MYSWPTVLFNSVNRYKLAIMEMCNSTVIHKLNPKHLCQKQNSQTNMLHSHTQMKMEWPKAVVFCCSFSSPPTPLGCVLAHTKHCESPRALGAAQGPRVLPSSLVSLSGRAGAGGSRRRPLPAQAAGPSLSGEPSGSWRCGAAGLRGGPGAAGWPWWGWDPWEEGENNWSHILCSKWIFVSLSRKKIKYQGPLNY